MRWRVAIVVVLALGLVAWRAAQSGADTDPSRTDHGTEVTGTGRTGAGPEALPPGLTVTSGGEAIEVKLGSFCWGNRCVETGGPQELVQDVALARLQPGDSVDLHFSQEPDEVTVHQWTAGGPQAVPLSGARSFTAPAESGTHVFSVSARWDGRGDALYAFTVQVE